mgnify:CR=1 FL=1
MPKFNIVKKSEPEVAVEVNTAKEHYIVYGQWKIYDDDGDICRLDTGNDTSYHATIASAVVAYNELIAEDGEDPKGYQYDLVYLDIMEEDEDEDELEQNNIKCWGKPETILSEKNYKCSDCDAWVTTGESCCGEEVERKDWWLAHNGNIEFITATEAAVEEMGADEWGAIRSFTDKRKKEDEEEVEWCEAGEHHVDKKEMWKDFGDCQNCTSEKDYLEKMEEEGVWVEKDCPIEENNDDCSVCSIILTDDDMNSETGKCEECLQEVEPVKKCEECDKILGWHNGEHEMTVEWFGKTTCGNCALVKAKYKLTE